MKNIGILTSGGDAPGMNAAIHSVVTTANYHSLKCIGFERGYNGLLDAKCTGLSVDSVRHISHLGGTIIKSARCERMTSKNERLKIQSTIEALKLDGLVVIGGDGSFRGANILCDELNIPIIGIPGTIDNDIDGSDYTIGFDTAANTALEAIDKVRDTADAFERIFIIEVMGRHSGHLALEVGIAAEAEHIICPEMNIGPHNIIQNIATHINAHLSQRGNTSYIMVLAENTYPDGSEALAKLLSHQIGIDCRATVLGHIQRGGMPSSKDRLLATQLGAFAVESLINGHSGKMAGLMANKLTLTPLSETGLGKKKPDNYLLNLYCNKLEL